MDCVRLVPEMLQEVVDLMTEKELRLRTPLEELDLLLAGSKPPEGDISKQRIDIANNVDS